MKENFVREFEFEKTKTCKRKWIFNLASEEGTVTIEKVKIFEAEKPIGCFGHPKTLMALLKGRDVNTLDIEELKKAECKMDKSCGQMLARCIENIQNEI